MRRLISLSLVLTVFVGLMVAAILVSPVYAVDSTPNTVDQIISRQITTTQCVDFDFTTDPYTFTASTYTVYDPGYGFRQGPRFDEYVAQIQSWSYHWDAVNKVTIRTDTYQDCDYYLTINGQPVVPDWTDAGSWQDIEIDVSPPITQTTGGDSFFVATGFCPSSGHITGLEICYYDPISDTCPTVPNYDFLDNSEWSSNQAVQFNPEGWVTLLSSNGTISQALSLTDLSYTAVFSVVANTDNTTLDVTLGSSVNALVDIDGPGMYTTTLTSIGPPEQDFVIVNRGNSIEEAVVIDYTCLYPTTLTTTEKICIAPDNGTFDDASAWSFYSGGEWNENEQNALLPIETEGAISQSVTLPVLPDVAGGNYWLLSFDARGKYSGDNAVYVSLDGPDFTDSLTVTLGTASQTYEIDASAYQESVWGLYFANLNLPGYITSTSDVFVDNVCLYWSDEPPANLPPPIGPPQLPPLPTITLTIDVTCDEVTQYLTDVTGIDFVALESIGIPADWTDLGGWFWWLAGRLWVYVALPIICSLLFFWNLLASLLETIVNFLIESVINPILENILNPGLLWLFSIYMLLLAFLTDPWGALSEFWEEYLWPFLEPYITPLLDLWTWVQETLWPWLQEFWNNPLGTIDQLISDMLQALLDWLFSFLRPIWDVLNYLVWLGGRFVGIIVLILWPFWWVWLFIYTLIPAVSAAITGASPVAALDLGDFASGFDFINGVVSSTPLAVLVVIVNAILWFRLIRWSIGQFSNMNS